VGQNTTKKLVAFFENAEQTSKKIVNSLPHSFIDNMWFTSIYNTFNFYGLIEGKKYSIPNDLFEFIKTKLNTPDEILSRIKVKILANPIFNVEYNATHKEVSINFNKEKKNVEGAIGFIHECGHALEYINLMDKGIQPDKKSFYYHESKAINLEEKFVTTLSRDVKKAHIASFLHLFSNTLFENIIYKNPYCDFDEAYGKARNIVCPAIPIQSNPFYVLDVFLIEMPCYSTNYSVIYNDLIK
jgi:hypothetical protein